MRYEGAHGLANCGSHDVVAGESSLHKILSETGFSLDVWRGWKEDFKRSR